jgi:hypothetical protein
LHLHGPCCWFSISSTFLHGIIYSYAKTEALALKACRINEWINISNCNQVNGQAWEPLENSFKWGFCSSVLEPAWSDPEGLSLWFHCLLQRLLEESLDHATLMVQN